MGGITHLETLRRGTFISYGCIIILTISGYNIHGQTMLQGTYHGLDVFQEQYSYYEFENDNTFNYHEGADLGDAYYGSGQYKLQYKLLILNFNTTKSKVSSSFNTAFWTNSKNTVSYEFVVKDNQLGPILGAEIEVPSKGIKFTTDTLGKARIRFDKEKSITHGTVVYLGYDICEFALNLSQNQKVEVVLNREPPGYPIKDIVDTLEVVRKGENWMELKDKLGNISKWKKNDTSTEK